jgi:signal transduction histidine kinase
MNPFEILWHRSKMNMRRIGMQIWTAAWSVGIRFKILGIVLGLVLLFGVGVTMYVRHTVEIALREELELRGQSIAVDLAARSTDYLLTNNTYALHTLVMDTVANNEDLRYALVIDAEGRVVAHSFGNGLPKGLFEANTVAVGERSKLQLLKTEEGWIWDVAALAYEGQAGIARVGLSETRLRTAVGSITGRLLTATALASVLGLAGSFLLTWILTRPIMELARITQAIGQGDLQQEARVWTGDEIGRLGRVFNTTIASLRGANTENQRYSQQLLQRNRELAALYAVATTLDSPQDLRHILDRALAAAMEATGSLAGWVTLIDEQTGLKELACWNGLEDSIACLEDREKSPCQCQIAIDLKRPLVISLKDTCPVKGMLLSTGERVMCHATAPLTAKGKSLGVINLAGSNGEAFSFDDLDLLGALAHELAVAVENAHLWEELKRKEELRGKLLDAVITAQEEERKRIARELHDDTGQAITSLMVGLRIAAEAPSLAEMVARLTGIREIAAETLVGLRSLVRDLRPSLLDDLGLEAALVKYIDTYRAKLGIPVDLEIAGLQSDRRLAPHIELALFRIIQEALTNIAKHANAHSVSVVVEAREATVVAVVEDDGIGFDVQQAPSSALEDAHLGLYGMRERAILLGGQLEMESSPGHGTTVQVVLPVNSYGTAGTQNG